MPFAPALSFLFMTHAHRNRHSMWFSTIAICCLRSSFHFLRPLFAFLPRLFSIVSLHAIWSLPLVVVPFSGFSLFAHSLVYVRCGSIIEMIVIQETVQIDDRSVKRGWIFSVSYADRQRSEYPITVSRTCWKIHRLFHVEWRSTSSFFSVSFGFSISSPMILFFSFSCMPYARDEGTARQIKERAPSDHKCSNTSK